MTEPWNLDRPAIIPPSARKKRVPKIPRVQDESEIELPEGSEEQLRIQLEDLYRLALSENIPAKRLWLDMQDKTGFQRPFDFRVSIVPYDIPDKSLVKIVLGADISVINEILNGILERLQMDEAPRPIRKLLTDFQGAYTQWFEIIYGADDAGNRDKGNTRSTGGA